MNSSIIQLQFTFKIYKQTESLGHSMLNHHKLLRVFKIAEISKLIYGAVIFYLLSFSFFSEDISFSCFSSSSEQSDFSSQILILSIMSIFCSVKCLFFE